MALYYDLPVFKEVYQLTLRLFQLTTDFPREYKFTLGQDLKRDCIILVRYIYRANKKCKKNCTAKSCLYIRYPNSGANACIRVHRNLLYLVVVPVRFQR